MVSYHLLGAIEDGYRARLHRPVGIGLLPGRQAHQTPQAMGCLLFSVHLSPPHTLIQAA